MTTSTVQNGIQHYYSELLKKNQFDGISQKND